MLNNVDCSQFYLSPFAIFQSFVWDQFPSFALRFTKTIDLAWYIINNTISAGHELVRGAKEYTEFQL